MHTENLVQIACLVSELHQPHFLLKIKWSNLTLLWAHLPFFVNMFWPLPLTYDQDLWPWATWPLTLNHVTFDLDPGDLWQGSHHISSIKNYAKSPKNTSFLFRDLALWPMTLTSKVDTEWPDIIKIHPHAKFHESPPCISTGGLKNWLFKLIF